MSETAIAPQKKIKKIGRPPIPNKERIAILHLYVPNKLIDRLEEAAPSFEEARAGFGQRVLTLGLDAIERGDATFTREDGSIPDHAVTYPTIQE